MADKTALLREAEEEFGELHQAIDGLTDDELGRVWLGTWSVREILIHVSGWHEEMITVFGRITQNEPPYSPGTYDDFDAWNARFVEARAGVKIVDVLTELDASHRRFVDAARGVPERHFAPEGAARDAFVGAGPGHYREHAAQIREWRRGRPH